MPPPTLRLPLDPGASLEALDGFLRTQEFVREPDRAGMNADQPEPVFVSWSRVLDDAEVDYTFEPRSGLRWVELRGTDAGAWAEALGQAVPVAGSGVVRNLLRAEEPRSVLQGLGMARLLADPVLAEDVLALLRHRDSAVREAAAEIVRSVLPLGARVLGDGAAIIESMIEVHGRRQTLRWMMRDFTRANEQMVAALRAALEDPDWEVRATAMIAAARFDVKELAPWVLRCELPTTSHLGPVKTDRALLRAVKQAVLARLAGTPLVEPPPGAEPKALAVYHLRRIVEGQPAVRLDPLAMFVAALTEPLDLDLEPPEPLPSGVLRTRGGYVLAGTELSLCWVGKVPSWLGDDDAELPSPNPLRRLVPAEGFFITTAAFRDPEGEGPRLFTRAEAERLCETLSASSGGRVRLPLPDEWERAARGPDGRRFPWGNGFEASFRASPSPWGCVELFGLASEWLAGEPARVAGGAQVRPCSHRMSAQPSEKHAARVVVASGTLSETERGSGGRA
jgi:hypothetical protein